MTRAHCRELAYQAVACQSFRPPAGVRSEQISTCPWALSAPQTGVTRQVYEQISGGRL
jgi:hypothetical protein